MSISKIITPNTDELDKIVNKLKVKKDEFNPWCLSLGIELVIIKSGSSGSKVSTRASNLQLPPYNMQTIDTSGAGDSFAGGLIAAILHNYSYEESVKIANACGAITTTYKGPHGQFIWKDIFKVVGEI